MIAGHTGAGAVGADTERRALLAVLRGGRDGSLPAFAATLGLAPAAFAALSAELGAELGAGRSAECGAGTSTGTSADLVADPTPERIRAALAPEPPPPAARHEGGPAPSPFLEPLAALLWASRSSDAAWTRAATRAVACACFGAHHLWQDLGLAGRAEVSALLEAHAPELAAGNTRGLRWKRYLFLRLGEALRIDDLRPPRCDGCDDFTLCYGSDPAPVTVHRR